MPNDMDGFYENIDEYNPRKERKVLIVFDDMITGVISNRKLYPIATELFARARKLSISLFSLQINTPMYLTMLD